MVFYWFLIVFKSQDAFCTESLTFIRSCFVTYYMVKCCKCFICVRKECVSLTCKKTRARVFIIHDYRVQTAYILVNYVYLVCQLVNSLLKFLPWWISEFFRVAWLLTLVLCFHRVVSLGPFWVIFSDMFTSSLILCSASFNLLINTSVKFLKFEWLHFYF